MFSCPHPRYCTIPKGNMRDLILIGSLFYKCFEHLTLVLFSSLLSTGWLSRFRAGAKPYPSWGSPSGTDVIGNEQIESSYLMARGARSSRGGRVSALKRLRIINSRTVFSNC